MSYIRSGSNPEGLYIYATVGNVCRIVVDGITQEVPTDDFDKLLAGFTDNNPLSCRYEGDKWVLRDAASNVLVKMCGDTWAYLVENNKHRYEEA